MIWQQLCKACSEACQWRTSSLRATPAAWRRPRKAVQGANLFQRSCYLTSIWSPDLALKWRLIISPIAFWEGAQRAAGRLPALRRNTAHQPHCTGDRAGCRLGQCLTQQPGQQNSAGSHLTFPKERSCQCIGCLTLFCYNSPVFTVFIYWNFNFLEEI